MAPLAVALRATNCFRHYVDIVLAPWPFEQGYLERHGAMVLEILKGQFFPGGLDRSLGLPVPLDLR